jgi:hypothetical protein
VLTARFRSLTLAATLGAIALPIAYGLAQPAPPPRVNAPVIERMPDVIAREQSPGVATVVEFVDFECPFCRRQQEALANMIERVFSSIGVTMSIRQAMSLAGADMSEFRRDYLEGPRTARGVFERELAGVMREGTPMYGTSRAEAAYETERANVGEDIAKDYRNIRRAEMDVVSQLLPSVVGVMGDLVTVGRQLAEAFSRDGMRGVFAELADVLRQAMNPFAGAPSPAGGGVPGLPPDTSPRPGRADR